MINSEQNNLQKQKILIVDDSEMNRSILADILDDEYEILEAEDGVKAIAMIQKYTIDISLVLLDIVMPRMDGFEVLTVMNQKNWIENIPVIMISAERGSKQIGRAYDLGVTDFIMRPFDALIVRQRVINTIFLYTKQKKLINLVVDQVNERERRSTMMVDILAHIVEFRNGESSQHIIHVRTLTEVLLRQLQQMTDKYPMTQAEMLLISTASSLHDIGKIAIDEKILNKPGRLTPEEFEVMKTHSMVGAKMLDNLPNFRNEPLIRTAYEICRWHHERYDGRGYPDGLKGDEIPISAQVVALADVYNALTSDRCYKKAIPHETAVQMILDGQCGTFSPLLMECLKSLEGTLEEELSKAQIQEKQIVRSRLANELLQRENFLASERSLNLLDQERMKYNFFSALAEEIQFEYNKVPDMLSFSSWGADKLKLDEIIMDPSHSEKFMKVIGKDVWKGISEALLNTSPDDPIVNYECQVQVDGQPHWYRIISQALWSNESSPQFIGAIGKAMDIHDSKVRMKELEKKVVHDTLTGLLNTAGAEDQILKRLKQMPDRKFALAIFDLDKFKEINDTYGHIFGNRVLKYVAEKLRQGIREDDIVARIGGDEFLVFLGYETRVEQVIERIFTVLDGSSLDGIPISISMGVARTTVVGREYKDLFHAADQALYSVKRTGRSEYMFYNDSMKEMLSMDSCIGASIENYTQKEEI